MTRRRSRQVLNAGFKAARDSMYSDAGLRRPEYPRNFQKLYSGMEDSLYDLYSAVQKQNCPRVKVAAADVIVAASKIVECAESLIKVSGRQEKAGPRKGTKKCSRCGFTKIVGEFWPDMSKPDGLRTHCKTCEKSYQRDKRKQRRKRRVTSSSGS